MRVLEWVSELDVCVMDIGLLVSITLITLDMASLNALILLFVISINVKSMLHINLRYILFIPCGPTV